MEFPRSKEWWAFGGEVVKWNGTAYEVRECADYPRAIKGVDSYSILDFWAPHAISFGHS